MATQQVAFLGTGSMGSPMVRRLLSAGLRVRAWNRTAARAVSLVDDGAELASSPAQAVEGADIIVTMLADGDAVESAMAGADGGLKTVSAGAVWAQMSTVGPDDTDRFVHLANRSRIRIVDAPVLGSREPAESGELVVLAAGAAEDLERCASVFQAVGSRTLALGPPGAGTRLKVVVNGWLMASAATVADTVRLAEALGVERDVLLDITGDGSISGVGAHMQAMFDREFTPRRFSLALAEKDASLAVAAAGSLRLPLFEATRARFAQALEQGHGEEDWSAVVLADLPVDGDHRINAAPR